MYVDRHEIKARTGDAPITRVSAKEYLRVEPTYTRDDNVIDRIIGAVQDRVETYTGRLLQPATVVAYPNQWSQCYTLPGYPIQAFTSVKYRTPAGTETTVPTDQYELKKGLIPTELTFTEDFDYPASIKIEIHYTAGYTDADDIPQGIYGLMWHMIYQQYDHRADGVSEKMTVSDKQMERYKITFY